VIFNLIKKSLQKPHLILPFFLNKFYNPIGTQKFLKNKDLIWHCCTPKSASSYLVFLMRCQSLKTITSMPYYQNRVQVSDFSYLRNQIKINNLNLFSNQLIYIIHQHSVLDNYFKQYISKKHKIIIQTRNIYKTILSFKDMVFSKNKIMKTPFTILNHNIHNEKDFFKSLIYNYVPFHCNFVKTWVEEKIEGEKIFINYKDFVMNEEIYLKKILSNYKKKIIIPKFDDIKKKDIKFAEGLKRKNSLTIEEINIIDEIVEVETKYSCPKVKSLIYQD